MGSLEDEVHIINGDDLKAFRGYGKLSSLVCVQHSVVKDVNFDYCWIKKIVGTLSMKPVSVMHYNTL